VIFAADLRSRAATKKNIYHGDTEKNLKSKSQTKPQAREHRETSEDAELKKTGIRRSEEEFFRHGTNLIIRAFLS